MRQDTNLLGKMASSVSGRESNGERMVGKVCWTRRVGKAVMDISAQVEQFSLLRRVSAQDGLESAKWPTLALNTHL